MSVSVRTFFTELDGPGARQVPPTVSGTLRFDIHDGDQVEHWLVTMAGGHARAEESDADADCVIVIDRELLERIVNGEERMSPAFVRYAYTIEGNFTLIPAFEWLLPDTVGARHPRQLAQGWKAAR
ncbi:SCP2 sterol-binding domain-containing protein [Micromonospora sp. NBC_01813]|uniref:SCP2 sterol-binding domain-containing protein n=1 Tax=Micromonospora sp. NBC_01813 TaxID=2975988 RepID=UPI002DD944C8|nr:SCP2 sterol-binding domain-containing protein [Micromonospora sp. NBC_01813]WSA11348.1 SCP2 sterol-binding domain-containing protein [Micromonospora sp. NBC_01813]